MQIQSQEVIDVCCLVSFKGRLLTCDWLKLPNRYIFIGGCVVFGMTIGIVSIVLKARASQVIRSDRATTQTQLGHMPHPPQSGQYAHIDRQLPPSYSSVANYIPTGIVPPLERSRIPLQYWSLAHLDLVCLSLTTLTVCDVWIYSHLCDATQSKFGLVPHVNKHILWPH